MLYRVAALKNPEERKHLCQSSAPVTFADVHAETLLKQDFTNDFL